ALRELGEEPKWNRLANTQHQHTSAKFGAVVNIWTSRGTVHVQGGGAARFEDALRRVLGEAPSMEAASVAGPPMQAAGVAAKSSSSSSSFLPAYSTSSTSCSSSSSAARTWTLYVDGSCPANRNVREKAVSPAGWGVAVYGPLDAADSNAARTVPGTTADSTACSCELFGPVVIENVSPLSLGAEVGSNNTG
ncbi:unnamed protein product, partial [Polarella glacialis]